ncbi:MAG: ArnT family glycosyltransferase [Vicinamibacterales bacterium]
MQTDTRAGSTGARRVLALGALATLLACTLYVVKLDDAPAYISNDEAHVASNAQSLSVTGRDLHGEFLPIFVLMIDPLVPDNVETARWQPFLFYLTAISLKTLPFTQWTVRLPIALMAILDVWLVYAIARLLFSQRGLAVIAAFLMATTPAHFIMGRQALDSFCPLTFALGWVWCLLAFFKTGRVRFLSAAGFVLGAGLFTYVAAWVFMPMYLALTLIALRVRGAAMRSTTLAVCGGFAAPFLVVVPWVWSKPDALWQTVARYDLFKFQTSLFEKPAGSGGFDLAERVALYWDFFNPSFLFFAGGADPTQTTTRAGMFLLPVAAFLALGIYRLWTLRWSTPSLILLAGFFLAPLPVVLIKPTAPNYSTARVMMLLPFGALIAAYGVEWWRQQARPAVRAIGMALVLMVPIQFVGLVRLYFTDYQMWSAPRRDPLNTRDVANFVMAHDDGAPLVYFRDDLDSKAVRWRFYLWKHDRRDLWVRTRYLGQNANADEVAPGSFAVFYATDPSVRALIESGAYSLATTITHESGEPAAIVLRRSR